MPPPYYRVCWHGVRRGFFFESCHCLSSTKGLYDLISLRLTHSVLLDQAFAHCQIFLTAASRGSLGRISVPVWPITRKGRLRIVGLVSYSLTNYLIRRKLIKQRVIATNMLRKTIFFFLDSRRIGGINPICLVDSHAFLTRSPLCIFCSSCKCTEQECTASDLHVLGIPPAFILSQDQTHLFGYNLLFFDCKMFFFQSINLFVKKIQITIFEKKIENTLNNPKPCGLFDLIPIVNRLLALIIFSKAISKRLFFFTSIKHY